LKKKTKKKEKGNFQTFFVTNKKVTKKVFFFVV